MYPLQKQNYEPVDPIIRELASENSLQIYTESKDVEVLSVLFSDETGEVRFEIWIDPVSGEETTGVHVYEVKKRIWERRSTTPTSFPSTVDTLKESLEQALNLVRSKLV